MSELEGFGEEPKNEAEKLERQRDLSNQRHDVAALGHRLNTTMIRTLIAKQFGAQTPTVEGYVHEGKLAKDETNPVRVLGRKMFALRTILGLTQTELARALRINRTSIIKYEDPKSTGKVRGTLEMALEYYIGGLPNSGEVRKKLEAVLK